MSISTFVVSYTHTVTYVTTKMLFLLKEIIREIGLDPANFANDWSSCERAISTWLASRHLERVRLEVYDPRTERLVTAWDIDVVYDTVGDGSLWVDADAVRYAIAKAGLVPSACRYASSSGTFWSSRTCATALIVRARWSNTNSASLNIHIPSGRSRPFPNAAGTRGSNARTASYDR